MRGRADTSPPDPVAEGPDANAESVARKILLDQLTGQARSRQELADKLAKKDVPAELATRLLDRFEEVGLIDDSAFARSWVASRQPGKGLARRALAQELRRKGIDDEVAREALDEIDPGTRWPPLGGSCARSCARSPGSTIRPPRGDSWACWPARATRLAWPSPSSVTSWPLLRENARVTDDAHTRGRCLAGDVVRGPDRD